jgi:plastocyanin
MPRWTRLPIFRIRDGTDSADAFAAVIVTRRATHIAEQAMLTRTTQLTLAMLTGILLAATGCGSDSGGDTTSPPPADNTVAATPSLAFSPATLTVSPGEQVTFAFGTVGHNVFFDPQSGAPANIEGTNASVNVARTFSTAGSFHYTCHIHPGMQGTIVVQ